MESVSFLFSQLSYRAETLTEGSATLHFFELGSRPRIIIIPFDFSHPPNLSLSLQEPTFNRKLVVPPDLLVVVDVILLSAQPDILLKSITKTTQ